MFTSGDVLFPEIFEITLGSEKGKYLVPQQGVVSGLNLGTALERQGRISEPSSTAASIALYSGSPTFTGLGRSAK